MNILTESSQSTFDTSTKFQRPHLFLFLKKRKGPLKWVGTFCQVLWKWMGAHFFSWLPRHFFCFIKLILQKRYICSSFIVPEFQHVENRGALFISILSENDQVESCITIISTHCGSKMANKKGPTTSAAAFFPCSQSDRTFTSKQSFLPRKGEETPIFRVQGAKLCKGRMKAEEGRSFESKSYRSGSNVV